MGKPLGMWGRVFRLKGTVIMHVWWQVILVLLYTTAIVYIHFYKMEIKLQSPILVDIMGVVTGLLLAFRTQTSYERYSQGRELWCQMTINVRNLTRLIWTGVNPHDSRSIIEKKSAINLLLAFAVSTKHYLREEYGYKYSDLSNLLTHITVTHVPHKDVSDTHRETLDDAITTQRDVQPSNIPLEISYYISSYINYVRDISYIRDQPRTDSGTIASMQKALAGLVSCLTSFEKIRNTPIPIAYSVHLTHLTWLYTLAIPPQIVSNFGWMTLPIVGLAAFAFLGILEIGFEIENPFSYEQNDLRLDRFCNEISAEIEQVLMQSPLNAKDWIFSDKNMPFYPKSFQTARQLVERPKEELVNVMKRMDISSTAAPVAVV